MSAGRRGLLLSLAFLGLALWLSPGERAHAQPPGRGQPLPPVIQPNDPGPGKHTIWQSHLSPDEIRRLLAGYVEGDNGTNDLLESLIRESVQKKNPKADPKQVDAAVKRLMEDKEFMNRVMDMAQKHKNQLPPGEQPKLSPEDLRKIVQSRPDAGNGGDPFKLPDGPLPPWDPNKVPKIDPKLFPRDPNTGLPLDPKTNQPFDPNTGFPVDPDTRKPFDPMTGKPIDPKDPPRFNPNPPQPPVQPKDGPPQTPSKIDPNTGRPIDPENPDPKRVFDPENPLGAPKKSPEQEAKTKAVEAATALWEKNVGPIDESPAVKRALVDLVSDSDAFDALTDDKGNSIFEMLQKDTGDGEKFGDWLTGDDSNWDWPKMDWKLNWGKSDRDIDFGDRNRSNRSRWDMPDRSPRRGGSSGLDGLGSFNFGSVQVPWLLVLILLAAVIAAVVLWKWKAIFSPQPASAFAADGLGPWPVDPREINTREDVVKAFEYLSVLICGPAARTWTHSTIADELSALAATHGETAVKLARLYELARYAPLDEPLTRAELLEARRLACDLAGVDEA